MTGDLAFGIGKWRRLATPLLIGFLFVLAALAVMADVAPSAHADPIPRPEGYPKLSLSTKTVTPTLAGTGGITLSYIIEIRNTGAYTAAGTTLSDTIPPSTTYNNDATASTGMTPTLSGGSLEWKGEVGFDATVLISYSVSVSPSFSGAVRNTAVISHPLIAEPVVVTAESLVTDEPILTIEKTASPLIPGANGPMTYTLSVANIGQPAVNLPITVTDAVPLSTTFGDAGQGGQYYSATNEVVWQQDLSLDLGETTYFTFNVKVGDVPSGTVIRNESYQVTTANGDVSVGEAYTSTVLYPILKLSKATQPDPPGSNREMTYILSLLNLGSLATDLVITDTVPAGSTYVRGGSETDGVVTWNLPKLDTSELAQFTFTVYISDVADIPIVNADYGVCSAESICEPGEVLTSVVGPPTFEAFAEVDPIAHKPGGGTGTEVTPTLEIYNAGPGNALDAMVTLYFGRLSVQASDLVIITGTGVPVPTPLPDGPDCGSQCVSYIWTGDLAYGETITFTTDGGQNTIGGQPGTHYTATIVITDSLSNMTTEPVSATVVGLVTHDANLIPDKRAPAVVGAGQFMTYSIEVHNTGLSTDEPPSPLLTDTVPMSVTVVPGGVSDGGITMTVSGTTVVSWTLPAMSPGDRLYRSFMVQVDAGLVSGTQIVNSEYGTIWYEDKPTDAFLSHSGLPVTTTVREVGLIDSFKLVTPALSLPGPGNFLTYTVHVVNTSPQPLSNVTLYDWLPWQSSTYQRDAIASAGDIISDIVSFEWTGDVAPFSEEVITVTVLVDEGFTGALTNTAVISHSTLSEEVVVTAVAYVTDRPVLRINKTASPDMVREGDDLLYTIEVVNIGQEAIGLVVTDTIPAGTTYAGGSANDGGQLVDGEVRWEFPTLAPGQKRTFTFRVKVDGAGAIVNRDYAISSVGGESASGPPVTVGRLDSGSGDTFLPLIIKK
ncbi:MAG TPA: hypothetical protein VLE70_12850 [Anaerolineae bacterium]|jgi:uncharacterized repeat protein (TIGR01451 family)|nr:hypothetical protein [Anaerolineae bacterium]